MEIYTGHSGRQNNKTSYYYKYNFVSPERIYTEVKEELRSYFQTGIVDDILFPSYTEDCLKRLGRSSYKIVETILKLEDFTAPLPQHFEAVRELWLVSPHDISYKMANSTYEQTTFKVDSHRENETRCNGVCAPDEIRVTYKTNGNIVQKFYSHHLLKPGSVNAQENCSIDSVNMLADSSDTFEIKNNKIYTNFPDGFLHLVYYIKEYDDNDYQLVPDNIRIKDYLKAYLKYKCFETIYNNVTDETFKQAESKFAYYKRESDEAKVLAETEIKKQTIEQAIRGAISARKRFNKYQIF